MAGIAFSTAALIVVLSVFNGLEDLMLTIYTAFDPSVKIEAAKGKSFPVTDELIQKIKNVPQVKAVTEVVEDYVYARYRNADMAAVMKGVSNNFLESNRLEGHLEGHARLETDSGRYAIVGRGVQHTLSINPEDFFFPLQLFYIRHLPSGSLQTPYKQLPLRPSAVFSVEKNFDENYIIVPLSYARDLLDYGRRCTSLDVMCLGDRKEAADKISSLLGSDFTVRTNEEQHQDLYKLLKIEKLFTALALLLLIIIASVNIFLSLLMLVLEKQKDISILYSLGASRQLIKKIFLTEGALIALSGAVAGLTCGALIVYLQQTVGLVGMGIENALTADYPVKMKSLDFMLVFAILTGLTFAIAFYPAHLAGKAYKASDL